MSAAKTEASLRKKANSIAEEIAELEARRESVVFAWRQSRLQMIRDEEPLPEELPMLSDLERADVLGRVQLDAIGTAAHGLALGQVLDQAAISPPLRRQDGDQRLDGRRRQVPG
jgi:hypothetical protein